MDLNQNAFEFRGVVFGATNCGFMKDELRSANTEAIALRAGCLKAIIIESSKAVDWVVSNGAPRPTAQKLIDEV